MAKGRGLANSSPSLGDGRFIPIETEDPMVITLTPTVSTAPAYTAGDAVGGLLTFVNAVKVAGGGGSIVKVVIVDNAAQEADIDLVLFDRTFAATADNAEFDPSDADLANCIGHIDVVTADYASFNDNSVAALSNDLRVPFNYDLAGTSLFGQMVTRDTPTFAAIDDITIKITVKRD